MCGGSDHMMVVNCGIKHNDIGSITNPNGSPNPNVCNAPSPSPNLMINDQCKIGPIPNSNIITNANTNHNYTYINAKMSNSMMKLPPPSQYRSSAVGLAIVAAIQAELDQSPAAMPRPSSPPIPIMASPVPATAHNCINDIDPSSINFNSKLINDCSSATNVYHHHKKKPKKKSFFKPIFSTTLSPDPLSPSPVSAASNGRGDFLRVCFFCKQSLVLSKDIFIYRGDRAFCSIECRYQQIVMDERKDRQTTLSCKGQEYQASKADKHKHKIVAAIG